MELEEITCIWLLYRRYKARRRRQRRWWVQPVIDDRLTMGAFVTLYPKLREHPNKFFNYFRMSVTSFDELLSLVKDDLLPCEYLVRDAISPEEKLAVTLRYLATGTSFADLLYTYKLGKSTISNIVQQVCSALWRVLKPICMPPISEER